MGTGGPLDRNEQSDKIAIVRDRRSLRRKRQNDGCKMAGCSVNSIRVKSDDEITPTGTSARKWSSVTSRFITKRFRMTVNYFAYSKTNLTEGIRHRKV